MQENLSLYHIFLTVGRTGNISQAARELFISQPAISKAIQKLEENLDTTLFKRNSRGVTLTPDGEVLFEKTKEAFSLLMEGENTILHNRSRDIPRLRLGASSTLSKYVLLSHLKPYITDYPQTRITITCQSTYQTLHLLDEGKIDVGLIGRPKKLQGYHFRPLLSISDTFVATRQYLKNQQELYPGEPLFHTATFMMLDEENITRQSVNTQLKERRIELSHILEVTSMDLLIQFAQISLGIACVIREFVQTELDEGILVEVPVGIPFPKREVGFVCRKGEESLPLLAHFFPEK
ncbi:MAG: LysR family transcriptional regulator [Lachnospiraceae bacterium]|nr:LysR family transcriptional regulator [Lachnospiraceae bacterium]